MHKQEKILDHEIQMTETVLAEQSDYVWDPEWSHEFLLKYQKIYQAKQLARSLFTKIMLEYTHLQLTQNL